MIHGRSVISDIHSAKQANWPGSSWCKIANGLPFHYRFSPQIDLGTIGIEAAQSSIHAPSFSQQKDPDAGCAATHGRAPPAGLNDRRHWGSLRDVSHCIITVCVDRRVTTPRIELLRSLHGAFFSALSSHLGVGRTYNSCCLDSFHP